MTSINDVFTGFKEKLTTLYDPHEVEALTLLSISEITGLSKAYIKAFPEKEITDEQSETLNNTLTRLQTGEPIQYIFGHTEFYGLPFKVDPSVLIPRPETEELVEWVLNTIGSSRIIINNVLDIGTGSGCIAVALKKHLPIAKVSAIDISAEALQIAQQNAELNKAGVKFINADILNIHKSEIEIPKSEIIISNPPYVTLHDKTLMHTNVTDFEPHTALFVPEDDPLIFYKAIADYAINNLSANGFLFLEINENLGKQTVELLTDKGFNNIELRKDMSGRDRMIRGTRI